MWTRSWRRKTPRPTTNLLRLSECDMAEFLAVGIFAFLALAAASQSQNENLRVTGLNARLQRPLRFPQKQPLDLQAFVGRRVDKSIYPEEPLSTYTQVAQDWNSEHNPLTHPYSPYYVSLPGVDSTRR